MESMFKFCPTGFVRTLLKKIPLAALSIAFLFTLPARAVDIGAILAGPPQLGPTELGEIQELTQQLLQICPPSSCVLIGIGRSPTPIMAYLELSGATHLYQLPLSAFRYQVAPQELTTLAHKPTIKPDYRSYHILTPPQRKGLRAHFNRFLPTAGQIQNKKIMLLDFAAVGSSLLSAGQFIETHYLEQGVVPQVALTATVKRGRASAMTALLRSHVSSSAESVQVFEMNSLGEQGFLQQFDLYSRFPPFQDYTAVIDPQSERLAYRELKARLSQLIEKGSASGGRARRVGAHCLALVLDALR